MPVSLAQLRRALTVTALSWKLMKEAMNHVIGAESGRSKGHSHHPIHPKVEE